MAAGLGNPGCRDRSRCGGTLALSYLLGILAFRTGNTVGACRLDIYQSR